MIQIYILKVDLFAHELRAEQIVLIHPFFLNDFSMSYPKLLMKYFSQNLLQAVDHQKSKLFLSL